MAAKREAREKVAQKLEREKEADFARIEREVRNSAGAGNLYPGDKSKKDIVQEEKVEKEDRHTALVSVRQKIAGVHTTGFDGARVTGVSFDGSPVTQKWEGEICLCTQHPCNVSCASLRSLPPKNVLLSCIYFCFVKNIFL